MIQEAKHTCYACAATATYACENCGVASCDKHLIVATNSDGDKLRCKPCDFVIPPKARSFDWKLFIDTAAESPHDIFAGGAGPPLARQPKVVMKDRSLKCYVSDRRQVPGRPGG